MKSLKVKGFRTIRDSSKIELKPITAIIGKNSCGKSSFIRFFPLLKQSTEKEISETLLWFGEYVDFGEFQGIKPNFDPTLRTIFELEFDITDINRYSYGYSPRAKNEPIYLTVTMEIAEKHIPYLKLSFLDQKIEIFLKEDGVVSEVFVNDSNELTKGTKYKWTRNPRCIIPVIRSNDTNDDYYFFLKDEKMEKKLIDTIKSIFPKTNNEKIENISRNLMMLRSKDNLYSYLCNPKKFPKPSKSIDKNSDLMEKINSYAILAKLPYYLQMINRILLSEIENIHYLKPIRASVNRFYRIQGLNIEHVDSDGSNLAMILYNLSDEERKSFEEWTLENFNIKFSVGKSSGHASLIIYDNDLVINLADTGYGYSQILPIILELWLLLKRKINEKHITVVIEQPELHLHPAFQAKVIDLFVQLIKQAHTKDIDLKIIFETHSETMINRLGERIYQQEISPNDVNILAFEKINNETTISSKSFTENGLIKDWPVGFFSMEE